MSAQDTGGPAFPVVELYQAIGGVCVQHLGITLRDYFAAKADIGNVDELTPRVGEALLGSDCPDIFKDPAGCLAWWAEYRSALRYIEADAMLKERNK